MLGVLLMGRFGRLKTILKGRTQMTKAEQRRDDALAARQLATTRCDKAYKALDKAQQEEEAALAAWDITHKEFLAARDDLEREDN